MKTKLSVPANDPKYIDYTKLATLKHLVPADTPEFNLQEFRRQNYPLWLRD